MYHRVQVAGRVLLGACGVGRVLLRKCCNVRAVGELLQCACSGVVQAAVNNGDPMSHVSLELC